jgi:hypothetical protein
VYRQNCVTNRVESCRCCPECRARVDRLERWLVRGLVGAAAGFALLAALSLVRVVSGG